MYFLNLNHLFHYKPQIVFRDAKGLNVQIIHNDNTFKFILDFLLVINTVRRKYTIGLRLNVSKR